MDKSISTYMKQNPDASVAEVRQFTYDIMQIALPNFTDLAETLSCEFMSELARKYGWDDVQPELFDTTDYELVNRKLHYLAGTLADGDVDKFISDVNDVTRFYIRRSAQENMIRNCDRMNVRYARVPGGHETCTFCFMLSSRRFVYTSEASAGRYHQFHPHCDCVIVPGEKGRTKIPGYDPEAMYENWKNCRDATGGRNAAKEAWDALSESEKDRCRSRHDDDDSEAFNAIYRNRIMREVETRDWHWLYTGEAPKVEVQEGAKPKKKESDVGDTLAGLGFRVRFLKPLNEKGKHTADALLNGNRWEIKQPIGDKEQKTIGKNTLDHQFEEAAKQSRRIILDITVIEGYESVGAESAVQKSKELFEGKWKNAFDEMLIFSGDGIRRYRNA